MGPTVQVRAGPTAYIKATQLDIDVVLLCYFGVSSNTYSHFCLVVTAYGSSLVADRVVAVGSGTGPPSMAVAGLDSSTGVVCFGYQPTPGGCRTLTASWSAIALGTTMPLSGTRIDSIGLAPLTATTMAVCYSDQTALVGQCERLQVNGSTIKSASTLVFNARASGYVALTRRNSTQGIVCYQDTGSGRQGTCKVLSVVGTALQVGAAAVIFAATTNSIATALLDLNRVVACYETLFGGSCKVLTITGTTITQGVMTLPLSSIAQQLSATSLYRTNIDGPLDATAVVCYKKDAANVTACDILIAPNPPGDQVSRQTVTPLFVSPGASYYPATARFMESRAVACYADNTASDNGYCRVLDYSTSTSTTSTTTVTSTTSTTSSLTTSSSTTYTTSTTTSTTSSYVPVPGVNVTLITFYDSDDRAGFYGGVVTWFGPSPVYNLTNYAVMIAPDSGGDPATRVQVGLDVPYGTNTLTIPAGQPTASFPYILVYTANKWGRSASAPFLAVRDIVRPLVQVQTPSFFDTDVNKGFIAGQLTWLPPAGGTPLVASWNVYWDSSAAMSSRVLLRQVSVGVNYVNLPSLALGGFTTFGIFAANLDLEASVFTSLAIADRAVPVAGASGLAFVDADLRAGYLQGTLTWIEPPTAPLDISYYRVFMSKDIAMSSALQLGGDLPVGTTSQVVGPNQLTGGFAYFLVWAYNTIGRQLVAPGTLAIPDRGLTFTDTDLRRGYVAGRVTWWDGTGPTPARLRVYLATTPDLTAVREEVALARKAVSFNTAQDLSDLLSITALQGDAWRLVRDFYKLDGQGALVLVAAAGARVLFGASYSGQALSTLVVPFTLLFGNDFPVGLYFDIPAVLVGSYTFLHVSPETSAGASMGMRIGPVADLVAPFYPATNVTFADQDFDARKVAGIVRWSPPNVPMYATQATGTCSKQITSLATCTTAIRALGLGNATAVDDSLSADATHPPSCYVENFVFKFNVAGSNTGSCSGTTMCICDVFDPTAPALTRYRLYFSDSADFSMGNRTLFMDVLANTTQVVIPLGTDAWNYGVVLVGGVDGFNELIPASVRLNDLALYGSLRARAEALICAR